MSGPRNSSALKGRLSVRFRDRPDFGNLAASILQDLLGKGDLLVVDVLASVDVQRLTFRPANKPSFVVVHAGTNGIKFWDEGTRSHTQIRPSQILRNTIRPARNFKIRKSTSDQLVTFELSMEDDALGIIRHEITVSSATEVARFGPSLLRVLHCGPQCHAGSGLPWDEIASAGLIVHEATFRGTQTDPLSELTLDDPNVVATTEQDFSPPEDYEPLQRLLRTSSRAFSAGVG